MIFSCGPSLSLPCSLALPDGAIPRPIESGFGSFSSFLFCGGQAAELGDSGRSPLRRHQMRMYCTTSYCVWRTIIITALRSHSPSLLHGGAAHHIFAELSDVFAMRTPHPNVSQTSVGTLDSVGRQREVQQSRTRPIVVVDHYESACSPLCIQLRRSFPYFGSRMLRNYRNARMPSFPLGQEITLRVPSSLATRHPRYRLALGRIPSARVEHSPLSLIKCGGRDPEARRAGCPGPRTAHVRDFRPCSGQGLFCPSVQNPTSATSGSPFCVL